jgi:thioredoxin 1
LDEDPEIRRIMDEKMERFLSRRLATDSHGSGQDGVIDVTDHDFDERIIRASLPAVVDFWASWCAPCADMEPVFRRVAARHRGEVIFARLNIDANRSTAVAHFVGSIPTMIIFQGGEEKHRVVGRVSEQELEMAIMAYISG